MRRFPSYLLLFCSLPILLYAADSTRVVVPDSTTRTDSTQIVRPDSAAQIDTTGTADTTFVTPALLKPPARVREFAKLTPYLDSLITLMFGAEKQPALDLDLPQMSSRFYYDPMLFRFSSSDWGEFETVNPLGMPASTMSCVDPLVGDESFANPIPRPGGEELTRMQYANGYRLLSPALAGAASPFGRPFVVYQKFQLPNSDTSLSKIYVTRGTGGFANTTFTFENHFGPAGIVNADGTFIKRNKVQSYSAANLTRLRLMSQPRLAQGLDATVGLFIDRLNGDKQYAALSTFTPGALSDNYSGIFGRFSYYASKKVNYRGSLVYRADDQRIDFTGLGSHQRFQVLDGHLSQQIQGKHNFFELGGDVRYLKYTENSKAHNAIYYNAVAGEIVGLLPQVNGYASASLRGSTDLKIKPGATVGVEYRFDSLRALSLMASRTVAMPQPEMLYLRPVFGQLEDTIPDYRISGDDQLESGYINSLESMLQYKFNNVLSTSARVGYANFRSLPIWDVDFSQYAKGDYRATAADRNLVYASVSARLTLPHGIFGQGAYAFRHVYHSAIDYAEGPRQIASGYAGIRFPIHKLKIMVNGAIGGRFRSETRNLLGGNDGARFVAEAYLGFDLKSFHFFYNYTNLLNVNYFAGGYNQPGRAIWWGFTWAFID